MHNPHTPDNHPETDMMNVWNLPRARVISMISQKGGVGKTTSTVNLGACFALSGHRTLVIGTDPSCGVSRSLGYSPQQLHGGLREVIISDLPLNQVTHDTELENLQIVAPDAWTLSEEEQYKDLMARQADAFAAAVDEARADFDTVLIDCPPGFGPETRASLLASDSYLLPVQAEELCRDTLIRLTNFIEDFRQTCHPGLAMEGLFLTMTDHRTRMSRHVAAKLDEEYGARLYDRSIPRNTRLTEMALQGKPTVIHDRRSSGSRAYFNLMDEIVTRYDALEIRPEPRVRPTALAAAASAPAPEADPMIFESGSSVHPDGLARLMRELAAEAGGGNGNGGDHAADEQLFAGGSDPEPPAYGDGEPDMVSLDDLLDEEEQGNTDDNDNGWGYGDDNYETIN
ncbi:ParA family protein [bacterium]|nr:ParA family protein [bacterium]